MNTDRLGRIVWHDLFAPDLEVSKRFYEDVASWQYVTEHATDFAWGGGEKDFVLARLGDEAGAGFIGQPHAQFYGWIPYVEVQDVDAAAELAQEFGGSVEKAPFEVPGVGRNCLLRDPAGALVGICLSRHTFPVPTQQFGVECYVSRLVGFPAEFYRGLFDWNVLPLANSDSQTIELSGAQVALQVSDDPHLENQALWAPSIRVEGLAKALDKARAVEGSAVLSDGIRASESSSALVCDPNGTLSYLIDRQ